MRLGNSLIWWRHQRAASVAAAAGTHSAYFLETYLWQAEVPQLWAAVRAGLANSMPQPPDVNEACNCHRRLSRLELWLSQEKCQWFGLEDRGSPVCWRSSWLKCLSKRNTNMRSRTKGSAVGSANTLSRDATKILSLVSQKGPSIALKLQNWTTWPALHWPETQARAKNQHTWCSTRGCSMNVEDCSQRTRIENGWRMDGPPAKMCQVSVICAKWRVFNEFV